MLTDVFLRLNITWAHRLLTWFGIFDGFHEWLEGLCPCDLLEGEDDVA